MTGTRASTKEDSSPTCHVLDYFYDDDNGFALTALVHTLRFHIIVDFACLESPDVQDEYLGLLDAVRSKDGDAPETDDTPSSKKRKRTADSGYGSPSPPTKPSRNTSSSSVTLAPDDRESDPAVRDLQNWILAPFGDIFTQHAPTAEEQKPKTVREWFHGPTSHWTLTAGAAGALVPRAEPSTPQLERRVAGLTPRLALPKYIRARAVPVFSSAELRVVGTSDSPSPRHPAVVQCAEQRYFLKLVDPAQPGPVKRELKLLLEIERRGIYERIRVPRVLGVVVDEEGARGGDRACTSAGSATAILGFLLTHIPDATPLTTTLDEDVAEAKRGKWARDVRKAVDVLHEHGIVWGDAKADNFLVDAQGEVWIIDFGGSYTEGWVDEELNETVEGDEMGTTKIVDAVRDPEGMTFDPDEEGEQPVEKKRKVDSEEDEVYALQHENDNADAETTEQDANAEGEGPKYCYCCSPEEEGKMIGCDGASCSREWFHVDCIDGMSEENMPGDDEKWFCDDCKA